MFSEQSCREQTSTHCPLTLCYCEEGSVTSPKEVLSPRASEGSVGGGVGSGQLGPLASPLVHVFDPLDTGLSLGLIFLIYELY